MLVNQMSKMKINMKQLFFDILTKVRPDVATNGGFLYYIRTNDNKKCHRVEISWDRTKDGEPKLEWLSPFKNNDYKYSKGEEPRLYLLTINDRNYEIPLTDLERCEVDKAIISVFNNVQIQEREELRTYIKNIEPTTAEEKLQKAQEDTFNNE